MKRNGRTIVVRNGTVNSNTSTYGVAIGKLAYVKVVLPRQNAYLNVVVVRVWVRGSRLALAIQAWYAWFTSPLPSTLPYHYRGRPASPDHTPG